MKAKASEMLAAADAVSVWAVQIEAVTKLAAVVGKIGSVEQAADEADARVAKARKDAESAEADVAKLKAEARSLEAARAAALAAAQADANKVVDEAREQAGKVKAKAEADAQAVIDSADSAAAASMATAEAAVSRAKEDVALEIEHLNQILANKKKAEAELDAVEKKIATARAAIAKALG